METKIKSITLKAVNDTENNFNIPDAEFIHKIKLVDGSFMYGFAKLNRKTKNIYIGHSRIKKGDNIIVEYYTS